MPNLRIIIFNSFSDCDLDEFNETHTRLDSVTTIHFRGQVKTYVQQQLIKILYEPHHESISMIDERIERLMVINDRLSIVEDIRINDVYFPRVKHLEIQLNDSKICIMKVFKCFKNLKTLTLHFYRDRYVYTYSETSEHGYTLSQINMIEILNETSLFTVKIII
jgi:hypothetical protein